jgi:hypothetical protein
MKRVLIASIGILLLGCSTGPDQDPAVGQYVLKTVNGLTVPANLAAAGATATQVTSGSVFINPDGGYQRLTYLRLTQSGTVTAQEDVDQGSWRRSGSTLSFTVSTSSTNIGSYSGSFTGSTLTLTQTGVTAVYEKTAGGGFCSQCL